MPVNITVGFVQILLEQNAALTKQFDGLNATVKDLTQTIRELKEQLNKNSKNSSKPPSSDGLKEPPVNKERSLRRKSGKKQGAQAGHDGVNLSVIADPDHVEHHMHPDCSSFPYHDSCLEKACIRETRHEIDAEVVANVTAHKLVVVNDCTLHGGVKEGSFPAKFKAAIQYGKNLQAMVVAFNTVGAVSINRTHEILGSVFNIPLWCPNWKYQDALYAVCCAHLLRELNGVEENHLEQTWAAQFKKLLLSIKKLKDKALADGKEEASYYHLHKF